MPHVVLRRVVGACFGLAALAAAGPALAADLGYPPPGPEGPAPEEYAGEEYGPRGPGPSRVYREERVDEEMPPPPRAERLPYGPRYSAGPAFGPPPPHLGCRTVVRHRVNHFGEEVRRRVEICDERVYGEPGPRIRPSGYGPRPVPPADIPEGDYGPQGY